jgi:hypothetical protein
MLGGPARTDVGLRDERKLLHCRNPPRQLPLAGRGDAADGIASGLLVQGLRGHVDAVWPYDRSCFWVNADAREVRRVGERLEHPTPVAFREIDLANRSVLEGQPESKVSDRLDRGYIN